MIKTKIDMKTFTKATLFIFFASIFSLSNLHAQDVNSVTEPDFIGEVIIVRADNTTNALEKSPVQTKTKAGASLYLVGIGNVKTKMKIVGCCAGVRAKSSDNIRFIVRAADNNTDPLAFIKIFEFESKKKERTAELASISTFGGSSSNNLKELPFTAKKFGVSSYLITITENRTGEFGIVTMNPNALDEKTTIISSFGIDAAE